DGIRGKLVTGVQTCALPISGLARAVDGLSHGALAVVPLSGPWSAQTLAAAFETAAALSRPVTLVANIATRHLWGSRASAEQLLRSEERRVGKEGTARRWR